VNEKPGDWHGVNLVVAITDYDWFQALRLREDWLEVNFWSPAPKNFWALQPGELFLFKLHAPRHFIVGGGVFAHAMILPCSVAWETFGTANGAADLAQMRTRISRYRDVDPHDRSDFQIGCRVLTQVFFKPEDEWLPVPKSWPINTQTLKTFSTDSEDGELLWKWAQGAITDPIPGFADKSQSRYGEPALIRPRLGQGAFRMLVTDAYQRRCAVTGERTLPALDAAHILPFSEGGGHAVSNGLLLRRDVHCLFDLGYVTVTPEHVFEVSPRIREEFENGRDYYAMQGKPLILPRRNEFRPDSSALDWHNNNRFLG
jgi:putative restriction endonuclease